jgi:hypothetical protein
MAIRLSSTGAVENLADFAVPPVVAQGETATLRIMLFGTGATLAAARFLVLSPDGQAVDVTSSFRNVSASFPGTFISLFDLNYTFQQGGHYAFFLHDTGTGDVWADKTFAAPWATNLDAKISEIKKQRTDVERVYSKVNRG